MSIVINSLEYMVVKIPLVLGRWMSLGVIRIIMWANDGRVDYVYAADLIVARRRSGQRASASSPMFEMSCVLTLFGNYEICVALSQINYPCTRLNE